MNTKKCSDEEILAEIIKFIQLYSYSPSYDDIMLACNYYSKATLSVRLESMRKKGLIDFDNGIARSITVPGYKYVKCDD